MQFCKLKIILKDTKAALIQVDKPVFYYDQNVFTLVEKPTKNFDVGSMRTFQFESEAELKRRFRNSKLFVQDCRDVDNMITIKCFEWRERPWLK